MDLYSEWVGPDDLQALALSTFKDIIVIKNIDSRARLPGSHPSFSWSWASTWALVSLTVKWR